ncbi:hypothetical protein AYX13_06668 [Cryptococcus neoformans]|nr:hypothetical protein AYX13_06668 [Cryptococcus neoformans var. grubii]
MSSGPFGHAGPCSMSVDIVPSPWIGHVEDRENKAIRTYTKNQKISRFQGGAPTTAKMTERVGLAFDRHLERLKGVWEQKPDLEPNPCCDRSYGFR